MEAGRVGRLGSAGRERLGSLREEDLKSKTAERKASWAEGTL